MSTTYVTVKDVLASGEKYGNKVLTWDPTVYRDLKQKNKNSKYDVSYITLKFKFVNGNEVPLRLKFFKVVTASSAKVPSAVEEDNIKNLIIAFREMSEEEILVGDYAPAKMASDVEQIIEDKKKKDAAIELYNATKDFNKALEIIDKSYQFVCDELKEAKSLPFSVRKDKKVKDITVYTLRQCTREDKENPDDEPIQLEYPIARIKLMLGKDGRVGVESWNNAIRGWDFRPNVYDSRKMTSKNNFAPVLATVKENGKVQPLNAKNAGVFITFKSIVGGIIDFQEIVSSKFGLSLKQNFKELYVKRNKSNLTESTFSKEDMALMGGDDTESEDDVEMPITEVTEKIKKSKISAIENSDLEDNDSNSDLEDDSESD